VLFKFNPDQTARTMAFESESLDLMDQPSFVDIDRLKKSGKYEARELVTNVIFFFVFNMQMKPFDQKEVRHAIKYAVNKPGIVKGLLGEHVIVADGFGPVFLPETLSKKDAFSYDPEKAKGILKQLGWKPGPDGILVKDGVRFEFNMMTPYGRYPMDKQITEAVQANLRAIGMDAKIDVVEGATFVNWVQSDPEQRKGSKVGLVTLTRPLGATLENAFVQHYHSEYFPKKGFNLSSYVNKEFDKLMESARTITDEKERARVYRKAQEILFEDMPVLPIYFFKKIMFFRPNVHNFDYCPPAYIAAPHVTHNTWMDK
jgi:peptide/nickel transport system substrate-binding protein